MKVGRGGLRGSCFKDNVRLFLPLPDGVCQGFCLSDAVLNIKLKGGGCAACMCACVRKSLQVFFFFCSFERKNAGTKLATRGGGEGLSAQVLLQVCFISFAL